jgi:predicted permease
MRVDPGFDYHDVLTFDASVRLLPGQKFDDGYAARNKQYTDQVIEALRHVPGVESVAGVDGGLPLTGSWSRNTVTLPGRGELKGENDDIDVRQVTSDYLRLLRIPLLKGRYLTADDRTGSTPVMLVNETAARKYWPGRDPLGQHASINEKDRVVVGVVGDIHHLGPEIAPRQECYFPESQGKTYGLDIVLRTAGDPMAVLPAAKAAVWAINKEQRFTEDTFTLEGYLDRLIAQRRFNMAVLAIFGVLGLVIAAVGIYGVMAYVVAQRTNEIGVRMALGATRANVVSMVLGRAALLVGIGLAIGSAGAWYLSAGVKAFLFQVQPNNLAIFAGALVVLAAAALLASVLPARRAASVDPLIALRSQ